MLDVMNRYAHGFVVVPVVLACRQGGVLARLESGPQSLDELADALDANAGHLQVALRLLESLGWIDRCADGRFIATPALSSHAVIPDAVWSLVEADMDAYLRSGPGGFLKPWLDQVASRWQTDDPLLADFLDSLLVVPVLALLAKRGLLKDLPSTGFDALPDGVRDEVIRLFRLLGWLGGEPGNYQLSQPGEFMVERSMNLGVGESYRPMLRSLADLLFGDAERVFALDASGHETHVDRSMNVVSSGFQHDRYFAEVDDIVVSIFSQEPMTEQPRYVADMGCGDGTFLKRVYRTVLERTPRGERLADFPLTMVGIDLNQASLDETSKTLSDIDHLVLRGDVGKPAEVADALAELGVDPEQVLHIRSFLDHDRPYVAPADTATANARGQAPYQGVYVDGLGRSIPAADAVQSLVEHLGRWAGIINRHGLILLEVHCQDPAVVRNDLDQSESLSFDALQGFSQQLLVEPDVALMAAAEVGLFPRREYFRKFPPLLPYCRITLNLLERRPYRVRAATVDDVPALCRLEVACWPAGMRAPESLLCQRIRNYPLGQWLVELDGEVVGAVYSQRVRDLDALRDCRFTELPRLHEPQGSVVQLLAINVLPEKQHLGLGDQLLNLMLMRSALQGGVHTVAGITRCKAFDGTDLDALAEYIEARDSVGRAVDPILQFHQSHGARFLGLVPDYRPEDTDNLGAGVLLCYALHGARDDFVASGMRAAGPAEAMDTPARLEACFRSVLGPGRRQAFSWDRPLREMGLDSLDLLSFRNLLEQDFGGSFPPTFYFSHPTLSDIRRYLDERGDGTGAARSAMPPTGAGLLQGPVKQVGQRRTDDREAAESAGIGPHAIVVIGMAGRFPGAIDLNAYWRLLEEGVDGITEVPAERWDIEQFHSADPDSAGRMVSRHGGFLPAVDHFDAAFFNISPREAELMDPQQRLLLELHWEALEHAAIDPHGLREAACGVYVGLYSHDYETLQVLDGVDEDLGVYFATGNAPSIAAGRLAYFLGTRGPALTVDTACSSSLVAVHQAMRALRGGECNLALASGVNLILSPRASIAFSRAGMLSPRGRCSTFDAAADGYVRSEGCGVVVLKRLRDALRDGDRVLAVLRGSALNQDGASNGLTAPSLPAQRDLLHAALLDAGLEPRDIDYLEAHGTGTSLGDPVEFQALHEVFGGDPLRDTPLWLGSVKTSIGHAEAAAGIAGLVKVILSMQRHRLPAHLHFREPNPHIDLDALPARIPVETLDWRAGGDRPLRAGVSSFGFSGTNAHVVVEQAPSLPQVTNAEMSDDGVALLLPLSARTPEALDALVGRYGQWLAEHPDADLEAVCRTAAMGRAHHEYRTVIRATDHRELREALARHPGGSASAHRATEPVIAFLFTGQGSQYAGMARGLAMREPAFREALRECQNLLDGELEQPLERILYPDRGGEAVLNDTANTQPALFAVEYALARLLESWGIRPSVVMGHSVGEYVAACVAGVFSLEDGLRLIAARGRLMSALPREGGMLAVLAPAGQVEADLRASGEQDVSVAAYNGPENVVLSGRSDALGRLGQAFERQGYRVVPLQVSHAFHSPLMEPMLEAFAEVAGRIRYARPTIEVVSNVTGARSRDGMTSADYWVRHIRQPVRFHEGVQALVASGADAVLELGPHPVLSAMGQACLADHPGREPEWLYTLAREAPDRDGLLNTVAALYRLGAEIDWAGVHAAAGHVSIDLPTYPWQRKRYWFMSRSGQGTSATGAPAQAEADWFHTLRWEVAGPAKAGEQRNGADPGAARHWLVFADTGGVGHALAEELRARGHRVLLCHAGSAFRQRNDMAVELDPERAEHYQRLLSEHLADHSKALDGVVHLWSLDAGERAPESPEELDRARLLGCESVTRFHQALAAHAREFAPRLWLVTRGAQCPTGTGQALAQAPLWGLGRVLSLEHPDDWGGLVDLAPTDSARTAALALCAELLSGDDEDQVALRDGERHVPRLVSAQVASTAPLKLDPQASYLVTGGLGRLGMRLARWLADRGARTLVLTGRTGVPGREAWDSLGAEHPAARVVEEIRALEGREVTVIPVAADVADQDAMAAVFRRFGTELPALGGVIHAAGLIETRSLDTLAPEDLERVFRAKVTGAWVLDRLCRSAEPAFFVLFSSAAAVWGSAGLAHYAAANQFLDALAQWRHAQGLPALSVNWGWWEGGGSSLELDELFRRYGVRRMPAAAALSALEVLLSGDAPQMTVASVDWPVFRPVYEARRRRPLLARLGTGEPVGEAGVDQEPGEPELLAAVREAPPDEALQLLQDHIREQVAGILRADVLDLRDDGQGFFSLGMDSLMTVQLRRRLDAAFGLRLPSTAAFQHPSVRALAKYLLEVLGGKDQAITATSHTSRADGDAQLDVLREEDLASLLDDEVARVLGGGRSGRDHGV
ncbi:SDR family NAD(P)-dependent oxidoreductase [Methylonatrum kenyense]|uniref:type I polyketide synthase n=1 Tax=Methylonatrum kenyense TaxID=455253 RepID=UPI0020BE41AA|nr:type I polyketide synthase [Methylonatrum kenyense]MCK8516803.1 SDR family NAD(P)-dependent oxidoreductase [Methylonatrum kenyense]